MSRRPAYTHYPRSILWLVPGGTTRIGGGESSSQPCFEVEVAPFYLSKWPITNEQMEAFDPGFERSPCSRGDRDVAVGVSWEAANAYAEWYAGVSRKPMRLPSEIEWEHACRAGSTARWHWGDDEDEIDEHVVHAGNWAGALPAPDSGPANPFGLYGTLGGVWEWTASPGLSYPLDDRPDAAPVDRTTRVLRGGSFRSERGVATCSVRRLAPIDLRAEDVGFRIAKSLR